MQLEALALRMRPRAPLEGFIRSGYQLTFTDTPTGAWKARESDAKNADFSYSLGFAVKDDKLTSVRWGTPAFTAALRVGDELIAIGERAYSDESLRNAIRDAKGTAAPIRLTSRQRRVGELAAAGMGANEVAQRLFLTPGTVRAVLESMPEGWPIAGSSPSQVGSATLGHTEREDRHGS